MRTVINTASIEEKAERLGMTRGQLLGLAREAAGDGALVSIHHTDYMQRAAILGTLITVEAFEEDYARRLQLPVAV